MITVPVVNMKGERTGDVEVDPASLGGSVRPVLIKQAIVAYLNHQRQESARTKRRSDVEGSTRKLYRQKGTGNARAGSIRTPIRRGGGRTFGKRVARRAKGFPKKMRRLATCSAVLAKIEAKTVVIVDDMRFSEPKTKAFASMLSAIGGDRGCMVASHESDRNLWLSGRNVQGADIRVVADLNAYEVLRRKTLVFTRPAFEMMTSRFAAKKAGSADH